jgi:hypothetical protein
MKQLGILITSTNDTESVWRMVQSASAKGVGIQIHLIGEGVLVIDNPLFQRLCTLAKVTICRESAVQKGLSEAWFQQLAVFLTPPNHITKFFEGCDRSLVF